MSLKCLSITISYNKFRKKRWSLWLNLQPYKCDLLNILKPRLSMKTFCCCRNNKRIRIYQKSLSSRLLTMEEHAFFPCNLLYNLSLMFRTTSLWPLLEYDYNRTRTHNYVVLKQTLSHLGWLNGWVFVYELSGCGFESRCSHLIYKYYSCFEQGVSWHSGNLRV